MAKLPDNLNIIIGCDVRCCKDCPDLSIGMRLFKMLSWAGCNNELSIIAYNKVTNTILIDKKRLMQAIQLTSPFQHGRDIELIENDIIGGHVIKNAD